MMLPTQEKALDVQALKYSKALSTSVQDDAHHRVVDETKKRAASQNVDYDTFTALVSVAHLKPIDQGGTREFNVARRQGPAFRFDAQGNVVSPLHAYVPVVSHLHLNIQASPRENKPLQDKFYSLHSTCAEQNDLKQLDANGCLEDTSSPQQGTDCCPKSSGAVINTEISSSLSSSEVTKSQAYSIPPNYLPLTCDGFEKKWRKSGKDGYKKFLLLRQISPTAFPIVFRVEIPPDILSEILEILYMYTLLKDSKLEQAVFLDDNKQQESKLEISGFANGSNADIETEALFKTDHVGMLPHLYSSAYKQIDQNDSWFSPTSDRRSADKSTRKDLLELPHLLDILTCLAKSGRFSLSLKLISKQAQQCVYRLLDHLAHEFKEEKGVINNLKSLYLQ